MQSFYTDCAVYQGDSVPFFVSVTWLRSTVLTLALYRAVNMVDLLKPIRKLLLCVVPVTILLMGVIFSSVAIPYYTCLSCMVSQSPRFTTDDCGTVIKNLASPVLYSRNIFEFTFYVLLLFFDMAFTSSFFSRLAGLSGWRHLLLSPRCRLQAVLYVIMLGLTVVQVAVRSIDVPEDTPLGMFFTLIDSWAIVLIAELSLDAQSMFESCKVDLLKNLDLLQRSMQASADNPASDEPDGVRDLSSRLSE